MSFKKPFKHQTHIKSRPDFDTLEQATRIAANDNIGVIFYQNGYFGVVWFINNIRMVRNLQGWDVKEEVNKVGYSFNYRTQQSPNQIIINFYKAVS